MIVGKIEYGLGIMRLLEEFGVKRPTSSTIFSLIVLLVVLLASASFLIMHHLMQRRKTSATMAPPTLVAHSCKYCQQFVIDLAPSKFAHEKLVERIKNRTSVYRAKIEEDGSVLFNVTRLEVAQAAADGCGMCQWILNDIGGDEGRLRDDSLLYAKIYHFERGFDINRVEYFGFCSQNLERSVAKTQHGFATYAEKDDVAARYVSTRPINPEGASEQSFQLARSWLEACQRSHKHCANPDASFMPTRVIEINCTSGTWNLCLRQTFHSSAEPYVALSYCWGGDQKSKTTRDTLARAQIQLGYGKLPKTIQDAVITTHKLGVRFLWVDSICIIQDEPDDMAMEIAQMPRIYSHAIVTIAASISSTAKDGFLQNRAVTQHSKLVFELPFQCPDVGRGSVVLFIPTRDEDIEPLDRRAWALQERLLASRALEFGTHQLRWICAGVESGGGYVDGWTKTDDRQRGSKAILDHECFNPAFKEDKQWLSKARSLGYRSAIRHWHQLRTAYTNRSLTQSSDRIVAISGIAERYYDVFQSPYLAGLWSFAMPFELLWKLDSRATRLRRPKYQGPSWSWVSINGGVEHLSPDQVNESNTFSLEVIDWDIRLCNSQAPYGAVFSGHLRVKGRLRAARWMRSDDSSAFRISDMLAEADGSNMLAARMRPDAVEDAFIDSNVASLSVFLLEVLQHEGSYSDGALGLVIRQIDEVSFTRVGLFEFRRSYLSSVKRLGESSEGNEVRYGRQRRWFEGCEIETITLI